MQGEQSMWGVGVCGGGMRCAISDRFIKGDHFDNMTSEPRLGESEGTLFILQGRALAVEGTVSAQYLRYLNPEMLDEQERSSKSRPEGTREAK